MATLIHAIAYVETIDIDIYAKRKGNQNPFRDDMNDPHHIWSLDPLSNEHRDKDHGTLGMVIPQSDGRITVERWFLGGNMDQPTVMPATRVYHYVTLTVTVDVRTLLR